MGRCCYGARMAFVVLWHRIGKEWIQHSGNALQQKIYNYETECTGKKGMIDVDRKSVDPISPSSIFATQNTLCSKCTKIFPSPGGQFCILSLRSDHRSTFTHILRNSTVSSFIEFQSYAVYAARAGSSVTDTREFNIEAARLCLANFD